MIAACAHADSPDHPARSDVRAGVPLRGRLPRYNLVLETADSLMLTAVVIGRTMKSGTVLGRPPVLVTRAQER